MARSKPYQREANGKRRGNPDGAWTHDLHQEVKSSLASRISSSSSKPSLLSRISGGQGKELIASGSTPKLHGFGTAPPINTSNANAGLELFPTRGTASGSNRRRKPLNAGRLVENGMNAALGLGQSGPRRSIVRRLVNSPPRGNGVSIMGASRAAVKIKVEHLAFGTTGEDVLSAFAPAPVNNAVVTQTTPTVTVELEVQDQVSAQELITQYDGAVADGNTLRLSLIKQTLAERMGRGKGLQIGKPAGVGGVDGKVISNPVAAPSAQELFNRDTPSKMYSDTILLNDPRSGIITLAQDTPEARDMRASAWSAGYGSSLSHRVGGGYGRR